MKNCTFNYLSSFERKERTKSISWWLISFNDATFSHYNSQKTFFYCCLLLNVSSLMYIFTLKKPSTKGKNRTETYLHLCASLPFKLDSFMQKVDWTPMTFFKWIIRGQKASWFISHLFILRRNVTSIVFLPFFFWFDWIIFAILIFSFINYNVKSQLKSIKKESREMHT